MVVVEVRRMMIRKRLKKGDHIEIRNDRERGHVRASSERVVEGNRCAKLRLGKTPSLSQLNDPSHPPE